MAMNLDLPDELDQAVEKEVEEGRFASKSEVIRTAVRRMLK